MLGPSRIRKRDGREERFDPARLADSLESALAASGGGVEHVAPLVEAVAGALALRDAETRSAEVAAAVELVLSETGFHAAADAYRGFREQRAERLAAVRVHSSEGPQPVARPWDRARLARSLARDRYLESGLARQIARAVERRLLDVGFHHMTGGLIAALAENECRSRGLRGDPLSGGRVGLERQALRAWLGGDCLPSRTGLPPVLLPDGADVRPHLGGEVLGGFALEELLSAPQVAGIESARFDLCGLRDWLRPACLRLQPREEESDEAFWERVRGRREAAREVQVLWPAGRAFAECTLHAPRWIVGASSRLRLVTDDARLARAWAESGIWVRLSLASWVQAAAEERAALAETGRVRLYWMPGSVAARRPAAVLDGFAVIHLPGAVRRVDAKEVGSFLEQVAEAVDLACAAVRTLARRGRGVKHARVALLPAGLDQALDALLPGAEREAGAPRLLLGLREIFESRPRAAGVRSEPAYPPHPEGAGARLAARDGQAAAAAYPVNWCLPDHRDPPRAEQLRPGSICFEVAPWLEFPAVAALEPATGALRAYAVPHGLGLHGD